MVGIPVPSFSGAKSYTLHLEPITQCTMLSFIIVK